MALACGFVMSTSAFAQSFCNTSSHSGTKYTTTKSYDKGSFSNGIGYEIWYDGGNNSATFYTDGSFSCSFSNTKDYLCRTGLSFNSTQTYKQIGQMYADFKLVKQNVSNVGYSYVGIYGWMSNPLVEFYIVDNWLSQYRPGSWVGDKYLGEFTIDGALYDVYTNTRYNAPSIEGDKTFTQYFSIRKTARDCGTIDITAHFKKWEELGLKMGVMYEAKILGEAGNTSGGASGTADFPYAKVYIGNSTAASSSSAKPASSSSVKPVSSSSEAKAAYSSNAIPGVIEFENYDYGGNGVSYKGAQSGKADYATDKRPNDDVDIIGTDNGYGVGNVQPDQWMEYTVKVSKAADYSLTVKGLSGAETDRNISFLVDGKEWNSVKVKAVADNWSDFSEFNASAAAKLSAGSHVIRAVFDGYANVDWFKLTEVIPPSSSSVVPSSSSVAPSSSSVKVSSSSVPPPSSSSVVLSSSSVKPVVSSSSVAPVVSSSSSKPVASSSSNAPITAPESSSSEVVLPPSSSSEIAIPASSSSEMILPESSSSVEIAAPSSSSMGTTAISKNRLQISDRDLLVFDMQGRFLGKIEVKNGEALNEALKARFHKAGAYLVKQGHLMQRVNVK